MTETRLRAFVGRSFAPEDKSLWHDVREILESFKRLGFAFEDAEEAQPKPISQKVKEGIDRSKMYIGILLRRRPFFPPPHPLTRTHCIAQFFNPPPPPAATQWSTS